MVILLKVGQPRFKRMLKMMDGMNQAVRENLVASRVVKAFVRGGYESKRFDNTTDDLRPVSYTHLPRHDGRCGPSG